jgi:putative ABC transport system substrate-binding protein
MPKVGVLMPGREGDPDSQARIAAFRQGFADLGWKDGQNVHIEYRWADGKIELIRQYAEELVALAPNVILANSSPVIEALKKITSSIPIVFALVNDPVGQGFAKSLSHPGGNITGFTFTNPEMIGKWVGLLKDMAPGITRAALLFNPSTAPFYPNFLHEIGTTRRLAVTELVLTPVDTPTEMETAIDALAQKPGSSLIIGPDVFNIGHINQIAQLPEKTGCRPSRATGSSRSKAGSWCTGRIRRTYSAGPPITWTALSRARTRPIFRCKNRPSSSWSSTSRPPRRSASPCRRPCSLPPTR